MDIPTDLKAALMARIDSGAAGAVWTPADFLDLHGRDAVDKTLQRLVKAGTVRRIDRGLYDKPSLNHLTKQDNSPDPREVIEAVARRDQIRVLVDGMTAANDLGLTNAVPAKIVVHTDARLKAIKLGNLSITFKQAAASKLYWAGRPAMRVVQALHWLRDTIAVSDYGDVWRRRLAALLADPAQGQRLRDDLADGMSALPAWMQALLRPMLGAEGDRAIVACDTRSHLAPGEIAADTRDRRAVTDIGTCRHAPRLSAKEVYDPIRSDTHSPC